MDLYTHFGAHLLIVTYANDRRASACEVEKYFSYIRETRFYTIYRVCKWYNRLFCTHQMTCWVFTFLITKQVSYKNHTRWKLFWISANRYLGTTEDRPYPHTSLCVYHRSIVVHNYLATSFRRCDQVSSHKTRGFYDALHRASTPRARKLPISTPP